MRHLVQIIVIAGFAASCGISSFKVTEELEQEGAEVGGGRDLPASSGEAQAGQDASSDDFSSIDSVKQEYVVGNALFAGCKDPAKVQTLQQNLNFQKRENCSFGEGDNLERKNNFVTARESQTIKANLPENSVVCDIQLASSQADLHYDDFLFITLNDDILVASEVGFADLFEPVNGLKPWDWTKIVDKPFSLAEGATKGMPYCLNDVACAIPGHDQTGAFSYSVNIEQVPALAAKVINEGKMDFTVIATGDDNDADCDHSSFNLNLEVKYAPIP